MSARTPRPPVKQGTVPCFIEWNDTNISEIERGHAYIEAAKVFMDDGTQTIQQPNDTLWSSMLQGLDMFSEDYLKDGIEGLPIQNRETWDDSLFHIEQR